MKCPKCNQETTDKQKKKKWSFKKIFEIFVALAIALAFIFGLGEVVIAGLLLLICVETAKFFIGLIKGESKKKLWLNVASIVFLATFCSIIVFRATDAPAIQNDYTLADLRNAPASCNPSYDVLLSIAEKEQGESYYEKKASPLIGLTIEDVNLIEVIKAEVKKTDRAEKIELLLAHQKQILKAWENAQKGRNVIKKLDSFEEIADLQQPFSLTSDEDLFLYISNLRNICHIYASYVRLQTVQGNIDLAIDEFVVLNSVVRKLGVNTRYLINKLVFIAASSICVDVANFIANDSETTQSQLERLAVEFPSLSKEQLSLRNALLFEYMMHRKMFNDPNEYKVRGRWIVKRNTTNRLMLNYVIEQIKLSGDAKPRELDMGELSVWPGIVPDRFNVRIDENEEIPFVYKLLYNPIGAVTTYVLLPAPAIERIRQIRTRLQIREDLLTIVLNKRLGKDYSLKARAYCDEYIIDIENKKIFSSGPDKIENTDDDIKLNINPKLLGWTN